MPEVAGLEPDPRSTLPGKTGVNALPLPTYAEWRAQRDAEQRRADRAARMREFVGDFFTLLAAVAIVAAGSVGFLLWGLR